MRRYSGRKSSHTPVFPSKATLAGGALGIVGGLTVAVGARMPWFTLFAGLHPYPGVDGLYGRLLMVGGLLAMVGGGALLFRRLRWLPPSLGLLGATMALAAGYLMVQLRLTLQEVGQNPMLIPAEGPGLPLLLSGALLILVGALVGRFGHRSSSGRPRSA